MSEEGTYLYTAINMSSGAEIPYFYGGQFVLEWDCTLFYLDGGWTRNNGHGRLYNGSVWVKATDVALNPTGNNPQCPDPKQGRVNFLVTWDDYYGVAAIGEGLTVPAGVEGTLVTLRWRTYTGDDFGTGTTDIRFAPKMKIAGYLAGSYEYDQDNVTWTGTSVAVVE